MQFWVSKKQLMAFSKAVFSLEILCKAGTDRLKKKKIVCEHSLR